MFTVIEMQNGSIGGNYWTYEDRPSAEVKLFQALAEVVKSSVAVHTVMLVDDTGIVYECRSYTHEQPEAEEETSTE